MYENSLTGQIVDGRVVLDPFNTANADSLSITEDSTSAEPTNPGDSFVAVNAPFDPESVDVAEMEPVEA